MRSICPICGYKNSRQKNCPICNSDLVFSSYTKVIYQGKKYKVGIWEDKVIKNFNIGNNKERFNFAYIKALYLQNVFRSTFLGLILPAIVFLAFSLIISTMAGIQEYRGNFAFLLNVSFPQEILVFFAVLFFIFALVFTYKIIIKKEKCIYLYIRGHYAYRLLKNEDYKQKIAFFDRQIADSFIFFKPIETKRLIIREFREDDAKDYYEFARTENVFKYMPINKLTSLEEAEKVVRENIKSYYQKGAYRLAIVLKDVHKVIGYIGLSKYDLSVYTCQVVYAIGEEYWHNGYVSEALASFITYLKGQNKKLIIAGHVKENIASGKVLLKNGFIRDPSRDCEMIIHGSIRQIINYVIDER